MLKKLRNLALGALVGVGLAIVPGGPAFADGGFSLCENWDNCYAYTTGCVTFYNRTAGISGRVEDHTTNGYTVAIFDAYKGDVKIETETRSANNESSLGTVRSFDFVIGDTNDPGPLTRIKITVCAVYASGSRSCSPNSAYVYNA